MNPCQTLPRFTWILIMACTVHITQGISMLTSKEPILVTATAMFYSLNSKLPGIGLIIAGMMALYGTLAPSRTYRALTIHMMLIVPQQIILFSAATSALTAMHEGRYADMTVRPFAFILADQCIYPYFAACHLCAVINQFLCDPLLSEFKRISL